MRLKLDIKAALIVAKKLRAFILKNAKCKLSVASSLEKL